MEQSKKANDYLQEFTGTNNWYKTIIPGITYTDGVHHLCETYKCWWFLDIVVSYQCEKKFRNEEFQVWELKKWSDGSWIISAGDGNNNLLGDQTGEYTDFEFDEAIIWFSHGVILLPSEY